MRNYYGGSAPPYPPGYYDAAINHPASVGPARYAAGYYDAAVNSPASVRVAAAACGSRVALLLLAAISVILLVALLGSGDGGSVGAGLTARFGAAWRACCVGCLALGSAALYLATRCGRK